MKKRNPLISHEVLRVCDSSDSLFSIQVTKHTQTKTGISLFSLDLNNVPVVTCDSYIFLCELLDSDFDVVLSVLKIVCGLRCLTNSPFESEE